MPLRSHTFPSADNAFSNLMFELMHDAPIRGSRDVGVTIERRKA